MPANRKRRDCDYPDCTSVFFTLSGLSQHKLRHLPYEERRYGCEFTGCKFRANFPSELTIHVNNKHLNIKLPCKLGCGETFGSPGAENMHRKRHHSAPVASKNTVGRSGAHRKSSHPAPVASNASENTAGRSDTQETFARQSFDAPIAAPSSHHDLTESYYATSPSASSSSVYTRQSIPHQHIQLTHQEAHDANHLDAAQSAPDHAPDAHAPLYLSRQGALTSSHPGIRQEADVSHTDHYWDRRMEDPLTLRGQRNVVQVQGENFSNPRSGHVPSYDKSRRMPHSPSLPPNPGMLF